MAKISVNKLSELLTTANAARRRRIVQDQKYQNRAAAPLYRLAMQPIGEFITQDRDQAIIQNAVNALRNDRTGTPWSIDDRWNTADALEHFLAMADVLPSELQEEYTVGGNDAEKLHISGVDVSVRPNLLINFTKRGKKYTGAVKFHFIKNPENALTKTGSEYAATLLYKWLEEFGPDGATPSHAHCISIDVFRETAVSAPKSTMRRMADITAACEEIAQRWQNL